MKNSFQGLANQRKNLLKKEKLRQEQKKRIRGEKQEKSLLRRQEKHRYDEIVQPVMRLLKETAYPLCQIDSGDESWSIGFWSKEKANPAIWKKIVEVRLLYDEVDGRAVGFECTRYHRRIQAELSQKSLQKALQQLFLTGETSNILLARRDAKSRLDAVVSEAFESFRRNASRDLKLAEDADGWSIGWWESRENLEWKAAMMIRLRFDRKNQPIGFQCSAGLRKALVGLDVRELEKAIKKLVL